MSLVSSINTAPCSKMTMTSIDSPNILTFEGHEPQLAPDAFVAPGAFVMGQVTLGAQSNIWYNCVLRGDVMPITVGARTNIQDLSMIHVSTGTFSCHIGDDVTIGHKATIHGCIIGNGCLIGMGAIILDGAVIEDHCLIAAGSIIPPGKRIPSGSVVMGAPGKVKRTLTEAQIQHHYASAHHYVELAERHRISLGW